MVQYIDKSVLVAEIESKRNDYINSFMTEQVHVLNDVLDFLDTLEVKEVDLDAEIMKYQREIYDRDTTVRDVAKHFFELGLRARKEEVK